MHGACFNVSSPEMLTVTTHCLVLIQKQWSKESSPVCRVSCAGEGMEQLTKPESGTQKTKGAGQTLTQLLTRVLGFVWLTPDETLLTLPVFPDTSTPVLREQPTGCVYTVNIHQNSFAALGASLLEHILPKAFMALTRSKGSLWSLPHLACRTRALKSNRP